MEEKSKSLLNLLRDEKVCVNYFATFDTYSIEEGILTNFDDEFIVINDSLYIARKLIISIEPINH